MTIIEWLNNYNGFMMVLATLLLVGITEYYARLTKHILNQTARSNQLNSRPILEILKTDKAQLLIDDIKKSNNNLYLIPSIYLKNIGKGPALNIRIIFYVNNEYIYILPPLKNKLDRETYEKVTLSGLKAEGEVFLENSSNYNSVVYKNLEVKEILNNYLKKLKNNKLAKKIYEKITQNEKVYGAYGLIFYEDLFNNKFISIYSFSDYSIYHITLNDD